MTLEERKVQLIITKAQAKEKIQMLEAMVAQLRSKTDAITGQIDLIDELLSEEKEADNAD